MPVPALSPLPGGCHGGLRLHRVEGDAMEPTLRGGRDYVLLRPVDTYIGEGLYLLAMGDGQAIVRCDALYTSRGRIRLLYDNELYTNDDLSRSEFDEAVVAYVVADVKVRDPWRLEGRDLAG